jgi:hypothetical protein
MGDWIRDNGWLWWVMGSFTAVSLLTAAFAVPWAVARMAPDYFMPDRDLRRSFANLHPVLRWTGLVLKNILGILLVALGAVFLVTPGQGLLTLLAGLVLINFPGKRALELWIIRFPLVLRAANWLRSRRGHAPLRVPDRS